MPKMVVVALTQAQAGAVLYALGNFTCDEQTLCDKQFFNVMVRAEEEVLKAREESK